MPTKIFFSNVNLADKSIEMNFEELEFVKWTPQYLIVKYPPASLSAGQPWRMGRKLVNYWLKLGQLKIEGDVPDWAVVI